MEKSEFNKQMLDYLSALNSKASEKASEKLFEGVKIPEDKRELIELGEKVVGMVILFDLIKKMKGKDEQTTSEEENES